MDEEQLARSLDTSLGEAIFGGRGQAGLWALLVFISPVDAENVERNRATLITPDSQPGR
jgi:hypothetical protein